VTPDRWRQITAMFERVVARPADDRARWLAEACGDDAALRTEVEALLDADAGAEAWALQAAVGLTHTQALARGATLRGYRIEAFIDDGGMGEVYRATDPRLGREVAIKVLPAHVGADPEMLARFTREARAVAALSHPNILAIHEFGDQDGIAYAVTELLHGETLRHRLAAGPLPAREAVAIAIQIAQGLTAAHAAGIVHRDLKPENVFLTAGDSVKILDFGLARVVTDAPGGSTPGLVMGTIGHMSPEQARGEPAGPGSDIFALGCVLYEMLAGTPPFDRASPADVTAAILRDEPAPLADRAPDVPTGLSAIVHHCLEKQPHDRFQSAADLVFALRHFATPSGAPASAESRHGRSRRGLFVRAGLALLLIVGAALAGAVIWNFAVAARSASREQWVQLTFDRGPISNARFVPNGQDVVFSAAWNGRAPQTFVKSGSSASSDPLPTGPAGGELLSISPRGELALRLQSELMTPFSERGTLARMPLFQSGERPLAHGVMSADWLEDGESLALAKDLGNGRVRLEVTSGGTPYETRGWISDVRAEPQGTRVAFVEHPWFDRFWGELVVYDFRTGVKTVLLSNRALLGLAWHPNRPEIWFGRDGGVGAVTLDKVERRTLSMPESARLHDISADGRLLLSQEGRRGRMLLQRLDGSGERDLTRRFWSMVKGFTPDSRRVLFSESPVEGGRTIAAIRPVDGSPVVELGRGDVSSVSWDGQWVAVVRSPTDDMLGQIVFLATETGESRTLVTPGVENATMPLFMPGDREIVFVGRAPGQANRLYRQAIGSSGPVPISPEGIGMSIGYMSPDGTLVAMSWGPKDIRLVPTRGGEPRRLPSFSKLDLPAGWSADGKWVYVRSGPMGRPEAELLRVHVESGAMQKVFTMRVADPAGVIWLGPTAVSPDERSVVFSYYRLLSSLCVVTGIQDR
jgi:serine/threonine protein kinase